MIRPYHPSDYYNPLTTFTDLWYNLKVAALPEQRYPDVDLYIRNSPCTRFQAAADASMAFKLAAYGVCAVGLLVPQIGIPAMLALKVGLAANAFEIGLAAVSWALSPHYKRRGEFDQFWTPTNVLRHPLTGILPVPFLGVKRTRAKFAECSID